MARFKLESAYGKRSTIGTCHNTDSWVHLNLQPNMLFGRLQPILTNVFRSVKIILKFSFVIVLNPELAA